MSLLGILVEEYYRLILYPLFIGKLNYKHFSRSSILLMIFVCLMCLVNISGVIPVHNVSAYIY